MHSRKPLLQRAARSTWPPGEIDWDVVRRPLDQVGRPLDDLTQSQMSRRFGRDFSQVRIHDDATAAVSSRAVAAEAFTVGNHVVFGDGRYAPASLRGERLLVHELTHVVQQAGHPIPPGPLAIVDYDEPSEQEARIGSAGRTGLKTPALARQRTGQSTARIATGRVHRVEIRCPRTIAFETDGGLRAYDLTSCNIPDGEYEATTQVTGNDVDFDFGTAIGAERFDFSYSVAPGQPNPATFFRVNRQPVHVTVLHEEGGGGQESIVHFSARLIDPAEFQRLTGVSVTVLPERTVVPISRIAASASADPHRSQASFPAGPVVGGAGIFTRTPMSMVPSNATGVLLTSNHASVFANVGGRTTIYGYRGTLPAHAGTLLPGELGYRYTSRLTRGIPGGWRNDAIFPHLPGDQSVIWVESDSEAAGQFAELLRTREYGGQYRYPPPRPPGSYERGSTESRLYDELFAGSEPQVIACRANNCITVPASEIEQGIGGRARVRVGDEWLDVSTGVFEPSGREDIFEAGRVARLREGIRSPEGLPSGVGTASFTRGGAAASGFVKVGGGIMLIYGVYRTTEHLSETYGTPEFRGAVGEEAGGWVGGLLGSAMGGAVGGAIACAPGGPIDAVCVVGGFVGGLIYGAIFGTAGARAGRAIAE